MDGKHFRNRRWVRRHTDMMRILWTAAALALGCAESAPDTLGELGADIDLTRCSGKNTTCDPERGPVTLAAMPALDPSNVTTCIPSEAPQLLTWWSNKLMNERCAPIGHCTPQAVKFAPDGAVWSATASSVPEADADSVLAGVFLGLYAQDKYPLAEKVVDTWRIRRARDVRAGELPNGHALELAPMYSGGVYVSLTWSELDASYARAQRVTWIAQFDAEANAVGDKRSIHTGAWRAVQLHVDRRDDVLIAASNGDRAALAKLNRQLEPEWVQTALPRGATRVVSFEDGRAAVVGDRSVIWLDVLGHLEHELEIAPGWEVVRSLSKGALLLREAGAHASPALAEVSRDGEVRWARRISFEPTADEGFTLDALHPSIVDSVAPDGTLIRFAHYDRRSTWILQIDPARERCSYADLDYEFDGDVTFQDAYIGKRNRLFFHASQHVDARVRFHEIGMLEER